MSTPQGTNAYQQLWEDFGRNKSGSYVEYRYTPTHRVGLSNYLREQEVLRLVAPRKDDVILDVGCAAGRQVFQLAPKVREAYGVDIAQSFVDSANNYKEAKGVRNTHFVAAPSETLPFPDAKFDVVICLEVLEHVFNKDTALTELLRVLRPGGRLVISTPNLNSDGTFWGRFMRLLGKRSFTPIEVFKIEELAAHGDAHVREFTMRSMREWLTSAGLRVESVRTTSFIDGPYADPVLKFPLHVPPLKVLIIWIEKALSATGLPYGRGLVAKATKIGL